MKSLLTQVHRQRLALAVDAARRGARVDLNQEWGATGSRQLVWYLNGAQRSVILTGDSGATFRAQVAEARDAYDAMLAAARRSPVGAVLERGAGEDAMEEMRR